LTLELSAADEGRKHKLRHRVFTHRIHYFAIVLLLLFAFAAGLGLQFLRAALLMYGMTYAPSPLIVRAYSRAFRRDAITRDVWIRGRRGLLEVRVMTPKDLPNAPTIVLVHGFAPGGMRDSLLNALAQRLCRSGLRVIMPDIKSEEILRIDRTAVNDVDDVIRWSATSSGQKVSVFGISFSGGMVITAAANPEYADYVKLTFCVSGYNSIDRLGRYYLHDDVRGPDGKRYALTPLPNALAPMALQYLDELVPPKDVEPLSNAIRTMVGYADSPSASRTVSLTTNQRLLLDDVLNVKTPAMRARYPALLERHRAELAYISPMGKIREIRGPLFILHGYADETIPIGEAEWTGAEGIHQSNVKMLKTSWVNHSVLIPRAPLRDKFEVVYFVSEMLDEALRPSPLHVTEH
jgi:pimeloyl-ACP methyl ester carboxylesterase